ncbi:MAG: hypothetical protein ACR9NN_22075 [Nostochopsis sp.]
MQKYLKNLEFKVLSFKLLVVGGYWSIRLVLSPQFFVETRLSEAMRDSAIGASLHANFLYQKSLTPTVLGYWLVVSR